MTESENFGPAIKRLRKVMGSKKARLSSGRCMTEEVILLCTTISSLEIAIEILKNKEEV